jgi:superfamily I DNA/RNA helicase
MTGRNPVDFSEPGVKIVNYMSAKGLEFDSVFLPHLHDTWMSPDQPIDRSTMYVMSSRARSNLVFQYAAGPKPPMLSLIPDNLLEQ